MKSLAIATLAFCAVMATADGPKPLNFDAQQTTNPGNLSGSFFHDWRSNKFSAVVINKIGDLTIKGKKTGFEFDGFAGAVIKDGAPAIAGFNIGYRRMVFDQVFIFGGFGVSVSGQTPVGFGGLFGFGIQF